MFTLCGKSCFILSVLTQLKAGHLAMGKALLEAGEWGKPLAWGCTADL